MINLKNNPQNIEPDIFTISRADLIGEYKYPCYEMAHRLANAGAPIVFNILNIYLKPEDIEIKKGWEFVLEENAKYFYISWRKLNDSFTSYFNETSNNGAEKEDAN